MGYGLMKNEEYQYECCADRRKQDATCGTTEDLKLRFT